MSAQFFGRSGNVLYGAFSIVGMAYQSQNINNGIPDDRVARSNKTTDGDLISITCNIEKSCVYFANVNN